MENFEKIKQIISTVKYVAKNVVYVKKWSNKAEL